MSQTTLADAVDTLVATIKDLLPAEVYHLCSDPHEGGYDGHIHIAIIADVDDDRLNEAQSAIAKAVEDANISLDFEPLIVYHISQPGGILDRIAREEGVRL